MARGVSFEAEIECGLIRAPLIHVVAAAVAPAETIAAVIAEMIAAFILFPRSFADSTNVGSLGPAFKV